MSNAAKSFDRLSTADIATALSYVPAGDRDTWVRMAMAIKSELGEGGFEIWNTWSAGDPSYNATDARDVWRSVKQQGKVSIGTLIKLAADNGYRPAGSARSISDEEYAERQRQRQAEADAERQRIEKRQARAATDAKRIWDAAGTEGIDQHPYILKKRIPPEARGAVRIGQYLRWTKDGTVAIEGALLVPIYGEGRALVSLQAYFPDGDNPLQRDRDYLPGGRKSGGYFTIGAITATTSTVLIAEGYATGAALHQATGHPVLVAFDAGNMIHIARMARERLPKATIVVCADNDRHHADGLNPGVRFGSKAAMAAAAILAVPKFDEGDTHGTDFDDLLRDYGADEVRAQVERAVTPQAPATTTPPTPANDADAEPLPGYDLGAVDWYTPLPDTNSDGKKPLATIQNLEEVIRRCQLTVRYNVISKEVELLIPGEGFTIDNQANASLAWLVSVCARFRMPIGQIGDFMCYLADRNPYNPVANWIRSRPWDGTSRLQALADTLTVEGEGEPGSRAAELKYTLLVRWMISAVAAAFNPNGVSAHGVLVLQGDQYLGKTKWFKSLVPAELDVIKDGLSLRPDDRDSVMAVVSNWMVELGELDATFRKSDIAALKAFLTRDRDTLRRAYARLESKYARRTVFFASVNPSQFLHDPTGNRRYWTLACTAIDHSHSIDMQQVWAEVYERLYRAGETWYLTQAEMDLLNASNSDFEITDPIRETAQSKYDWQAPRMAWRWLTATEIMHELGFERPNRADVNQCGQIIGQLNGKARRKSNGRTLLNVPPKHHAPSQDHVPF